MYELTLLFALVVLLLGVLAYMAMKPAGAWRKCIVLLFAGLLGAAYFSQSELLSRPKPVSLEWARTTVKEATVLHFSMVEGEAIDVLLQWGPRPRFFEIPWSRKVAEELQRAKRNAGEKGKIIMRLPFEHSWETKRKRFRGIPQPKLPDKPLPKPGRIDKHPERAA